MKRLRWLTPLLVAPVVVALASCGGSSTHVTPTTTVTPPAVEPEADLKPLESMGWATLKGKVTLDGTAPKPTEIPAMKTHKDHATCEKAPEDEKIDQTWLVGPDGAVENVVVFLQQPAGKFFKIKDEDKKKKGDVVVLDQPFCAFVPHVFTLFPKYHDDSGTLKPTGQVLAVKNSATISHNTAWQGDPAKNPPGNKTIGPDSSFPITLNPQTKPVQFKCDIHNWMQAKAWVFAHPYAARTNKKGEYEIKNVPAGVEVQVVAWHEGTPGNWILGGSRTGEKMTFEDGKTKELDFKVKK